MKHPEKRLVPAKFEDFNWADHEFLRFYICDNIKMEYWERQLFDPTFYPAEWDEYRELQFKCIPMSWSNSKIRVVFIVPGSGHKITNRNTNIEVHNWAAKEENSYLKSE
jgi:hypothetical protein